MATISKRATVRKMGLIVLLERVPWPESVDYSVVSDEGTNPPVFLVFTLIVVAELSLTFSNEVVFVFHATRMK